MALSDRAKQCVRVALANKTVGNEINDVIDAAPVIFLVETPTTMKAGDIKVFSGAVTIYNGSAWIPIITV
jgi:hypothetical protein